MESSSTQSDTRNNPTINPTVNPTPSGNLDARTRNSELKNLSQNAFDLVVIGGGITGAGIARDAALRGLNVALLEAQDFASGTSSRSTKLVHGGLRYLAQGDVKLVREAATERAVLEQLAPHLAQTQSFLLPVTSKAAQIKFRAGLWSYEKLGQVAEVDTHRVLSLADIKTNEPALDTNGWHSGITYGECITEDARLTIANIRSAKAAGATVINYCKVQSFQYRDDKICGVNAQDMLSEGAEPFNIKANLVVNAAGPWVDTICKYGHRGRSEKLQLTKGVHIVLPRRRLPLNKPLIATAPDKRTLFLVPKDNITYVGTTDTFHTDAEYWPQANINDINYLLETVNHVTQGQDITADDIVSLWTGIRPLIADGGKKPSEISRKDETWESPDGLLSIAGGKLTAYRRMAERVADVVERKLGKTVSICRTAEEFLPGGDIRPEQLQENPILNKLEQTSKTRLIRHYGSEALKLAKTENIIDAEINHSVINEGALTLEDFWIRRSGQSLFEVDAGLDSLNHVSEVMGELLGWSKAKQASQVQQCRNLHEQRMACINDRIQPENIA